MTDDLATTAENQFIGYLAINWRLLVGVFSIWFVTYLNFSIAWILVGLVTYLYMRHAKNERKKELAFICEVTNQLTSSSKLPVKYLPTWVSFIFRQKPEQFFDLLICHPLVLLLEPIAELIIQVAGCSYWQILIHAGKYFNLCGEIEISHPSCVDRGLKALLCTLKKCSDLYNGHFFSCQK